MLTWTFHAGVVMAANIPNIGYDALGTNVVKINLKSGIIAMNLFFLAVSGVIKHINSYFSKILIFASIA